jgi:hypothetical protein
MKGTKTNYILNDHYFDISLLKHSVDYFCIYTEQAKFVDTKTPFGLEIKREY